MRSRRRFPFAMLATTSLASMIGCGRDTPRDGHWVTCTCPYLTDFDQVAHHSVDVCVAPNESALEVGKNCAARVAHGPTESCTCNPPRESCDGKEPCRSNEYR